MSTIRPTRYFHLIFATVAHKSRSHRYAMREFAEFVLFIALWILATGGVIWLFADASVNHGAGYQAAYPPKSHVFEDTIVSTIQLDGEKLEPPVCVYPMALVQMERAVKQ